MRKLLYILLLFACTRALSQQSLSISGTVKDKNGVLPGATVFITNSRYSTATDDKGKFTFNNIPPGTYEVVVKMIGYDHSVQSVNLNKEAIELTVNLKASNTLLKEVTIKGVDPNRFKYLLWFKMDFIGQTNNSLQCRILNPDVLSFHYDKDSNTLTTTASDFLVIENRALGYRIKYLLKDYEVDLTNNTGFYSGYPYFEELQGNEAQQKKWEANRKLAYLSSGRHFFKAVMNNTAEEEGFVVYKITRDRGEIKTTDKNEFFEFSQNMKDTLAGTSDELSKQTEVKTLMAFKIHDINSLFTADENFKHLTFPDRDKFGRDGLFIIYTREDEADMFSMTGKPINIRHKQIPAKRQISRLTLFTDTLTIDKNGILTPDRGFKYSGYSGWLRLADLTPLDYFVKP